MCKMMSGGSVEAAADSVAKGCAGVPGVQSLALQPVSPMTRTRETWRLMEPVFGGHPRVEFLRDLYLASPRIVLATIAATPRKAETIMVLGHNPSTHALAAYLSRTGDESERDRLRTKFPTGAVAVIELSSDDWTRAEEGGELLHLILPRRLERREGR